MGRSVDNRHYRRHGGGTGEQLPLPPSGPQIRWEVWRHSGGHWGDEYGKD